MGGADLVRRPITLNGMVPLMLSIIIIGLMRPGNSINLLDGITQKSATSKSFERMNKIRYMNKMHVKYNNIIIIINIHNNIHNNINNS